MTQDETNKKTNVLFIYGLICFLAIILIVSFIPSFGVVIGTSQLVIIAIIVVLLLFRYFDIIEIPGFLKLSKEIKELKNETKEIKQNQMNMMQTIAVRQNARATSIQIIGAATREAKQEAEALLPELPAVNFLTTPTTPSVQNMANTIMEHVQRRNYSAAFLDLRRIMDSLVRDITGIQDSKVKFFDVLRTAQKDGLINSSLADSINSVRKFGNIAIHMTPAQERRIQVEEVQEIVDLGLRVVNELEKIRTQHQH